MSHNKISVNSQNPTSSGNVDLTVSTVVNDTPLNNETIRGTAAGGYEFGNAAALNPLSEYFFAASTRAGGSQGVTAYGYITQYIDNRTSPNTNVELGIESAGQGGDGVNYGGAGDLMHSQIVVDVGNYFVEFYPAPRWTSAGGESVIQFVTGNDSSTADVKGNRSYCYDDSPSRNFYARVKSDSNDNRVWPKILSNTNQRIGAISSTPCQSMIAYKI